MDSTLTLMCSKFLFLLEYCLSLVFKKPKPNNFMDNYQHVLDFLCKLSTCNESFVNLSHFRSCIGFYEPWTSFIASRDRLM